MKIVTQISDMQAEMQKLKQSGLTIGFVPTMGYLHEGHMTLMRQARRENDIVVLSVFVNPLQFGPNEDFDAYPRDLDHDQKVAEEAGVDYMFFPAVEEMYPRELSVSVVVKKRTNVLCGKSRPGHFDGVATVLTKLFSIVQPNKAYFGLKDAQQVAVVSGLVEDFHFPIELVPVDIVREEDGLAKSSRNVYLSDKERNQSPTLYQSLLMAQQMIIDGERRPEVIKAKIQAMIESNTDGTIDYIEILSYPDLEEMNELNGKIIIALAVKFSRARLIDNIVLTIQ